MKIKLKSLATIKDVVLFAVCRPCDHHPEDSDLCIHVQKYIIGILPPSLLSTSMSV